MLPAAGADRHNQNGPTREGAERLAGFAASLADSAGQPWDGREFQQNTFGDDEGRAPHQLVAAMAGFREGQTGPEMVIEALRSSRVLIPLVAEAGARQIAQSGLTADASQELSIVTVAGPDGRTVLPIFSSVETMKAWNPHARPVPVSAERAALAAASDGTDLLVLDPTSPTEFAVRRPAVWALAQRLPWLPPDRDPDVQRAFSHSVDASTAVLGLTLASGDPNSRLRAEELVVRLSLTPGLSPQEVGGLLNSLARLWGADEVIAAKVDSLRVELDG